MMNNKVVYYLKKNFINLITFVSIVFGLICFSERIKSAIENAIYIWVNIIVPSVFPYLVLSKYICSSDMMSIFETFPGKPISKIFKLSSCSIKPFLCSLFCGYPSGAIGATDLYKQKLISKDEAKRLICFTNNAGPLFLISAVGTNMLGSFKKGIAIYLINLLSALLYGLFCSLGKSKKVIRKSEAKKHIPDICLSIKYSVEATVNVCGFMIAAFVMSEFFIILTDTILLDSTIQKYVNAFIKGIFEISAGVNSITFLNLGQLEYGIICSFVSWSGLSVIMQIKSISENIISTKEIVLAKLCQAIISFILGCGYKVIFKTSAYISPKINYVFLLSVIFSVVLFLYYMINKKKKLSE